MHIDVDGVASRRQLAASILTGADQLFLFRVDRDGRLIRLKSGSSVGSVSVAFFRPPPGRRLRVADITSALPSSIACSSLMPLPTTLGTSPVAAEAATASLAANRRLARSVRFDFNLPKRSAIFFCATARSFIVAMRTRNDLLRLNNQLLGWPELVAHNSARAELSAFGPCACGRDDRLVLRQPLSDCSACVALWRWR